MIKNLLLLFALTLSTSLIAQNMTGSGNVSSVSGILLPNAVVRISPVGDSTLVYEYVCDKNGNYTFNLPPEDTVYLFSIFPSTQTLQFAPQNENITLSEGDNGMFFHKVKLTESKGIRFNVVDGEGNTVEGAAILLYDTKRKWRIDSAGIAKAVYTDQDGQAEVNSLLPEKY